jgi:hypothetical protein
VCGEGARVLQRRWCGAEELVHRSGDNGRRRHRKFTREASAVPFIGRRVVRGASRLRCKEKEGGNEGPDHGRCLRDTGRRTVRARGVDGAWRARKRRCMRSGCVRPTEARPRETRPGGTRTLRRAGRHAHLRARERDAAQHSWFKFRLHMFDRH